MSKHRIFNNINFTRLAPKFNELNLSNKEYKKIHFLTLTFLKDILIKSAHS
jgi:hypothetical protein